MVPLSHHAPLEPVKSVLHVEAPRSVMPRVVSTFLPDPTYQRMCCVTKTQGRASVEIKKLVSVSVAPQMTSKGAIQF